MDEVLLKVKNLTAGYGAEPVIKDISFEVRRREKLCILGANGCGKSTLLKTLCGFLDYQGEVLMCGEELAALNDRARARRAALLSQFAGAAFDFTVRECVAMGRYPHSKPSFSGNEDRREAQIIEDSMRFSGVSDLSFRLLTELSGGQLQRVFLARTIAQQPNILLLDEPANHLDLPAQKRLTDKITEWTRIENRCAAAVFHDLSLALKFADTALIMKDGRVIDIRPSKAVDFEKLNLAYDMDVRAYMRSMAEVWK